MLLQYLTPQQQQQQEQEGVGGKCSCCNLQYMQHQQQQQQQQLPRLLLVKQKAGQTAVPAAAVVCLLPHGPPLSHQQ
jgi:hypothetical protein